ncbi:MAG: hypothetical protein QOI06_1354 [Nocardioidaceae bacterium]|nr:hypothetical protein [Nocardioidaceae bacterium]
MKYVVLSYGTQADWDAGEHHRELLRGDAGPTNELTQSLIDSGEFVYAVGLADPSHTEAVEVRDGVPVVTDGPYAQATVILSGFAIVDVASHDRALEVAAQAAAVLGRVELRPLGEDAEGDPGQ